MPRHKQTPWRADPATLERIILVDERVVQGQTNVAIAEALGVDEKTIRKDRARLQELWLEQAGGEVRRRRLLRIAQLEALHSDLLKVARRHERMLSAVLTGGKIDGKVVTRDQFGRVEIRVQTAQLLGQARAVLMDLAKIEGLVIEKIEHSGEIGVRREYVGVDVEKV